MIRIVVYGLAGGILAFVLPGLANNYILNSTKIPMAFWPVYLIIMVGFGAFLADRMNKRDKESHD